MIIAALESEDLLAVADLPEAANSAILNVRSDQDDLGEQDCRQNVFHILPNYAIRADALAQYLIWKRWSRWFLVTGKTAEDKAYAQAVKRAAPWGVAAMQAARAADRSRTFTLTRQGRRRHDP